MAQLSLTGIGNTVVTFTLPALTVPATKTPWAPVPVANLPGEWFGFFPYVVTGSPVAMAAGFAGDHFGPFAGTANTTPLAKGPFITPITDATAFPALPGMWPGPKPLQPGTSQPSPPSVNITITDSNGTTVYVFDGQGGQAMPYVAPGSYPSQTFTLTPNGLLNIPWFFYVP